MRESGGMHTLLILCSCTKVLLIAAGHRGS